MEDYSIFRNRYRSRRFGALIIAGALLHAGWTIAGMMGTPSAARAARIEAVEEAAAAFDRATASGAEYRAPYEYAMAREYLELARQEVKEGDVIGIHEFTAKSVAYSNQAIEKSRGGGK
ncbi:MAG: hypothetical protein Kow00128_23730 [Deltaproteobacteria bacterium]